MFRKVLVPIDGSDQSIKAVNAALDIANKYGSQVTLFHVAQIAYDYSGMGQWPEISSEIVKKMENEWNRVGKEILEKAAQEVDSSNIEITLDLEQGNAAREIIYKAEKGKYDLIVIGSRGLGGISAAVMGSVSNQVSRTANCPVLIIH